MRIFPARPQSWRLSAVVDTASSLMLVGVVALLLSVPVASFAEQLAPVVEASSIQEKRSDAIEARLSRLERLLENKVLINLSQRLSELEGQLQQVQGEVELQIHKQDEMVRKQQAIYLDLDERLEALEAALSRASEVSPDSDDYPLSSENSVDMAAPATDEAIPGGVLIGEGGVAAMEQQGGFSSSSDPALDYSEAYTLLKNGQYDEAINAFRNFLQNHADTDYADNAQYWLGEANYVTRRFSQAIAEFGRVISDYESSQKVPGALLKIGYAHYELEEWPQARVALERLISEYPESSAARLAENRLKRMDEEGV